MVQTWGGNYEEMVEWYVKSGEFHGHLSTKHLVSERIYVPPIFWFHVKLWRSMSIVCPFCCTDKLANMFHTKESTGCGDSMDEV